MKNLLILFSLFLPMQASASVCGNSYLAYFSEKDIFLEKKSKKGRLIFQHRYFPKKARRVPLHRRFFMRIYNRNSIYGRIVGFSGDTLLIKDIKLHKFLKIHIKHIVYISRESEVLQKLVECTWFCLLMSIVGIMGLPCAIIKNDFEAYKGIGIFTAIGGMPLLLRELFKMDYDLENDWYLTIKK